MPDSPKISRFASIDIIRGAVMILMAIDHVRVFAGVPAMGPTFGVFFTRWVTHFCAPAFLFLAGTSAFLYGRKHGGLPRFLLTRGIWLVFLELTFLRVFWTFNFDFAQYEMAGVIWVIGWCMILMAGLVYFPTRVVGIIGIVIVAGHNLLDPHVGSIIGSLGQDFGSALWKIFYIGFFAGPISGGPDGPTLIVLYSIIPWIGVMAAGYGFGLVLQLEPERRNRICVGIGLGTTALFLVLRGFNLYGEPMPWGGGAPAWPGGPELPAVFSFLNTSKYPASLQFLLMTLGPMLALIPVLDRASGRIADALALFGRVPFFFYVLHIPLIHVAAIVASWITLGEVSDWLFANHPMGSGPAPEGYMWSLGTLYLVWGIVTVMLYFACRWYAGLKRRRTEWWLRYL